MNPQPRPTRRQSLNDLGVAIADNLDATMRERGPVPPDTRDLVINLRNVADALVTTAEVAAKAPTIFDQRVVQEFRLAVMLVLKTCGEVPAPIMPGGDRLMLVPRESSAKRKAVAPRSRG